MVVADRFIYAELCSGFADVTQDRWSIGDSLGVTPRAEAITQRVHVGVGADAGVSKQVPRAAHRLASFEYDEALRRAFHFQVAGSANARQPRAHHYDVYVLHSRRNYISATKKHKRRQDLNVKLRRLEDLLQ